MKLNEVKVRIEGMTPLLCNKFTDAAALRATACTTTTLIGDKGTPLAQAEARLYLDGTKEVIPQPNLFRCLIDAGTYFKAGKSKVTTQKTSLLPACVEIPGVVIPIEHKQPWKVDTRPVRIPSTGGRILCHRPMFDDWALTFGLLYDPDMISASLLREIVDAAGRRIGLGDFRPACKGPFGKFVVTRWKED